MEKTKAPMSRRLAGQKIGVPRVEVDGILFAPVCWNESEDEKSGNKVWAMVFGKVLSRKLTYDVITDFGHGDIRRCSVVRTGIDPFQDEKDGKPLVLQIFVQNKPAVIKEHVGDPNSDVSHATDLNRTRRSDGSYETDPAKIEDLRASKLNDQKEKAEKAKEEQKEKSAEKEPPKFDKPSA